LHRDLANLSEAARIAEELGDPVRLSRVLSSQTYLLSATGDLPAGIAAGERALALIAAQEDLDAAVNTRLMLARTLYAAGRYNEALQRARSAIDLLGEDVERGALGGINQTVSARVWVALCHTERGEFEAAAAVGVQAMRLAEHPACSDHEVLWSRLGMGRLYLLCHDWERTITVLEPALPLCKGEMTIYFSRVASSLGAAYTATGRVEDGLELLRQADERALAIGFTFGHALVLAQLAEAFLLSGDHVQAQEAARRALEAALRWGERGNEGWAKCALAMAAAARGDAAEMEARYEEALAIAEQLEMAPLRERCRVGLRSEAS